MPQGPIPTLVGRDAESVALRSLIADAAGGLGRSVVVVGEPGIGKSALLQAAVDSAPEARALRVSGSEPEKQMSYAGLHRILRPLADEVGRLPEPQRAALQVTFGELAGPAPSRFLVGLASLTALGVAARTRPVLCVVDDLHWMDRESVGVLSFVARRLERERVALVLATRDEPAVLATVDGVDRTVLTGLTSAAAAAMLAARVPGRMHPSVVESLVAHSNGNPLAVLAMARSLSAQQRAGVAALPDPLPLADGVQDYFLRAVAALPAATQEFVLLAACGSADDPQTVWRAAHQLGLTTLDADPAAAADICSVQGEVRFSHPLVRSAVYGAAQPQAVRAAHAALADATATADPDRRAWHLAEAAGAPDDAVAAELELSAQRAHARGGHAAQATFLRRAAELTTDPALALTRALDAADAYVLSGELETAAALVERTGPSSTGLQRARGLQIEAEIAIARTRPASAAATLMHAVAEATPGDRDFVRGCLFDALLSSVMAGRYLTGTTLRAVAAATLATAGHRPEHEALDRLHDALATRVGSGFEAAAGQLRTAVDALTIRPGHLGRNAVGAVLLGMMACDELWDVRARNDLLDRLEPALRQEGSLIALAVALAGRGAGLVREGRLAEAGDRYAESMDVAAAYGVRNDAPLIVLYAWQGRVDETRALADLMRSQHQVGLWATSAAHCLGILGLGVQEYAAARDALVETFDDDAPGLSGIALPDLVEAAARAGDDAWARRALDRLTRRASATGTPWAASLLARSQALLATDDDAEKLFVTALELVGTTPIATDLARTHLLYGEWLRRSGRRVDARVQLRKAHTLFTQMGAGAFAERARSALLATGVRARVTVHEPGDATLTPQESRIATLAARGLTNSEIASSLFVTASTVEFHMTKILRKTGTTSRRELRGLLGR
ncbi:AAA family ATPase [Cellulomonas sp. URHD0024]|uniref:helix-turn-helix transcriptional regulator n=1 Tax=Cellulomonas sp. URHD0024 TaxID=1302620 RepID=UPI0003F7C877|nr:AAA family ATPase [Cellulomonas sp. URHD0024]